MSFNFISNLNLLRSPSVLETTHRSSILASFKALWRLVNWQLAGILLIKTFWASYQVTSLHKFIFWKQIWSFQVFKKISIIFHGNDKQKTWKLSVNVEFCVKHIYLLLSVCAKWQLTRSGWGCKKWRHQGLVPVSSWEPERTIIAVCLILNKS